MLAREAGLHPSQLSQWRRRPEVRSSSDMVAEPENQNIRPSHRRVLIVLARTPPGYDVNALLTRGFKIETMGDLVRAGLATVRIETVEERGLPIEIARIRITDAGRKAIRAAVRRRKK
jgi:transposase-like protein